MRGKECLQQSLSARGTEVGALQAKPFGNLLIAPESLISEQPSFRACSVSVFCHVLC